MLRHISLRRLHQVCEVSWVTKLGGGLESEHKAHDLAAHNGAHLTDCHIADPYVDTIKPHAVDEVEAERLWPLSEVLVCKKFLY